MLLIFGIAFLVRNYYAQAIPVPTPDILLFTRDDSSDSDGSHSRTVLDIVWSCLATTFACTWVSVHPNVPFKGEGNLTILKRRLFLMFFSILAPEMMIMWAFKQWRGAVMIKNAVNDSEPGPIKAWTTAHGHFLQMGGFKCLITEHELVNAGIESMCGGMWRGLPSFETTKTTNVNEGLVEGILTFKAFKLLLSENLIIFPNITEDEINDRSKGDALSKGIAFLQLTWFIIQIITRVAQGLAVTELELTTAALAGLNSVMYVFWWNKPLAVRYPVVIRTKGVDELPAEKVKDVKWKFKESEFQLRKHLWELTLDALKHIGNFLRSSPQRLSAGVLNAAMTLRGLPRKFMQRLAELWRTVVRHLSERKTRNHADKGSEIAYDDPKPRPVSATSLSILNDGDLEQTSGVSENEGTNRKSTDAFFRQILPTAAEHAKMLLKYFAFPFALMIHLVNLILFIPITRILPSTNVADAIPFGFDTDDVEKTMRTIFYSEDADTTPLLCSSSVAGALFGMIHCLAWHFIFPSRVERIMWRTASLCVVGVCTLTFIGALTLTPLFDAAHRLYRPLPIILFIMLNPFIFLIPLVYPIARISLLVLAFTSLRSLPSSAFDTVRWVELVPHI